ncbi:SRPBCC family protein [Glycomyces tarimensis]
MTATDFEYTAYLHTTPHRLWQALIEPAFTTRYWGVAFVTDWEVGSPMTWEEAGGSTSDPGQVVLEYEPPRRLAYTWHSFTPEWAQVAGVEDEMLAKIAAEPRSHVAFELEPVGATVKLTVVHGGFEPASTVREMIGEGWPHVVSNLKTLLETGETLPAPEPPPAEDG